VLALYYRFSRKMLFLIIGWVFIDAILWFGNKIYFSFFFEFISKSTYSLEYTNCFCKFTGSFLFVSLDLRLLLVRDHVFVADISVLIRCIFNIKGIIDVIILFFFRNHLNFSSFNYFFYRLLSFDFGGQFVPSFILWLI